MGLGVGSTFYFSYNYTLTEILIVYVSSSIIIVDAFLCVGA